MALKILSSPSQPDAIAEKLRGAIESALAGSRAVVRASSPGHFEITVVWQGFAGASKLKQQQQVYRAITPLMSGDAAPVHAVDRLECRVS
jgi:acid stress-induced BolA-like protein IbaG/YrbA